MKVLILGSTGMLGQALMRVGDARGHIMHAAQRSFSGVDITDGESVRRKLEATQPDVIINTAAVTSVDACESNPSLAYRVNGLACAIIANAARTVGARFVQISTDHFYSGDGAALHDENSPMDLVNEYARSKLVGEAFALFLSPNALVVRTNVVGLRGWKDQPTFVEWCVHSMRNSEVTPGLFDDYYTSPIDAETLSNAIYDLNHASGVVNVSARAPITKANFYHQLSVALGYQSIYRIASVKTLKTPRAESCGLDVTYAGTLLQRQLPTPEQTIENLARQINACK